MAKSIHIELQAFISSHDFSYEEITFILAKIIKDIDLKSVCDFLNIAIDKKYHKEIVIQLKKSGIKDGIIIDRLMDVVEHYMSKKTFIKKINKYNKK